MILGASVTLLMASVKTELIFGEINYNLSSFKVIYYLMNDLKQKHKLNSKNYNKLTILSRGIQILTLDFGTIFIIIFALLFMIKMAILSGNFFWILLLILMTPFLIIIVTQGNTTVCITIITFTYYILQFGQINDKINFISNSIKKIIII